MIIDPFDCPVDDNGREQVIHGSTDFPIACYYNDLLLVPVLLHWHEELETGIVTEGTAVLSIGSEKHILKAGDGFFINTGILHDGYSIDDALCKIHSMVFHPRLIGGNPESVFYRKYLRPLLEDPTLEWVHFSGTAQWHADAITAIEAIWNSCRDEVPGYEFSVRSNLSQLIWQIYSHRSRIYHGQKYKALRNSERIKLMLSFIHDNYPQHITTTAIASSAAVSESECLRCFRSTIGTSPIQYLKQHRLRQAAMQLLSCDDKISEIAERCGFQDMSYFTKSFREAEGCSPTEYRKDRTPAASVMEQSDKSSAVSD